MMRKSPPKHRHDGTSPLPLGMDWSPAPRKWNGRDTVWPHDPRTGWSYCLTIPSWVPLPKSRDSDPVVFYRVQVGLQSPEGITTTRRVLRRFNHFLKLFTDLKRAFPKKNFAPAPPKGILRIKSRVMLEERRRSLEEWMMKLLSDIDVSRSVSVASFLELEAAARSSFEDIAQQRSEANPSRNDTSPSLDSRPSSSSSVVACGLSLASDYGSDSAYETSDIGTPRLGRDSNSGIGIEDLAMDEESTNPIEKLVKYGISNIDEGLFMGEAILEQLESFPKHKLHGRQINSVMEDTYNGSSSNVALLSGNRMDIFPDPNQSQAASRLQQLSSGSVQSDSSSLKCSDLSDTGIANSPCDGLLHLPEHVDSSSNREPQYAGDAQIVLPIDHRHKLNRVLVSMQRRLVTAKTDMEDVIARLSQEIAVKDYLATKVKDLEVELEATRQKNKETLKQAVFSERERVTRMQWDMEELRRKCMEMELRLKSKQNKKLDSDPTEVFPVEKVGALLPESDDTKEHLENLQKQYTELEIKSKADIKVLVKEVKSLRSTQVQLKQELSQSLKEQSETKEQLKQVKQESEHVKLSWKKLLHDCRNFHRQLQESNFNFLREDGEKLVIDSSSFPDALDLLKTSDKQIGFLQSEAQLLAHSEKTVPSADKEQEGGIDTGTMEDESRQLLADIFAEFGRLRERVNAVIRRALETGIEVKKTDREEAPSEHIVLDSKILER